MCFMEDAESNDGTVDKPYANQQTQKHFGRELQKLRSKGKDNRDCESMREMRWKP